VYAYAGISVLHWSDVRQQFNRGGSCGNAISDPLLFLLNWVGPLAGLCLVTLTLRGIRCRRRPLLPIMLLPLFVGTTAALLWEVTWLREFGFPDLIECIRWLHWLRWL